MLEVIRQELHLSGSLLRHLKFSEEGILVDGRHVTVRYRLSEGECLSLAVEDRESGETATPVALALPVVYEDADVVVPNKPADMPTHPSCGHHEDTVANALAYRYQQEGIPFVFRPVNRLDRNTSGLLLIARHRIAAARLGRAMQRGEIRKTYLAIVEGELPQQEGSIRTYMRRTAQSVILRENCEEGQGGSLALTRYRVLEVQNGHSLVWCAPLTGRTHQLRVHFAGLGCPLLGDDLYGRQSSLMARHALHSVTLSFPSPAVSRSIYTQAPLPEDFCCAMEALSLRNIDPTALACPDFF